MDEKKRYDDHGTTIFAPPLSLTNKCEGKFHFLKKISAFFIFYQEFLDDSIMGKKNSIRCRFLLRISYTRKGGIIAPRENVTIFKTFFSKTQRLNKFSSKKQIENRNNCPSPREKTKKSFFTRVHDPRRIF